MADATPRIKGFPLGWVAVQFYECACGHDRDAVVLAERSIEDRDHGLRYVVWNVNMELGGCFRGDYTEDIDTARRTFDRRRSRLR